MVSFWFCFRVSLFRFFFYCVVVLCTYSVFGLEGLLVLGKLCRVGGFLLSIGR